MTTLDYEVSLNYNRRRVAEIRDSVRPIKPMDRLHRNVSLIRRFRHGLGGALIAAGQHVCGRSIGCDLPRQTVVGRASS